MLAQYAIIVDGVVDNIIVGASDMPGAIRAHTWTRIGDVVVDGVLPPEPIPLQPEPLPLEDIRASAFDALTARRWQAETAGISIGGMAIPTDRDSQALITGAVAGALIDPAQIIAWKTAAKDANGAPISVPLDADTIKAVTMAVRAHVQSCFDIESDKGAELGALPDQDAIQAWLDTELDAGWPDSKQADEAV